MNRYDELNKAYQNLDEATKKYKRNVMIIEINKKIKRGEIKTLKQLFEALDLPWIERDLYGRGMKNKQLPKDFQIELYKF